MTKLPRLTDGTQRSARGGALCERKAGRLGTAPPIEPEPGRGIEPARRRERSSVAGSGARLARHDPRSGRFGTGSQARHVARDARSEVGRGAPRLGRTATAR